MCAWTTYAESGTHDNLYVTGKFRAFTNKNERLTISCFNVVAMWSRILVLRVIDIRVLAKLGSFSVEKLCEYEVVRISGADPCCVTSKTGICRMELSSVMQKRWISLTALRVRHSGLSVDYVRWLWTLEHIRDVTSVASASHENTAHSSPSDKRDSRSTMTSR